MAPRSTMLAAGAAASLAAVSVSFVAPSAPQERAPQASAGLSLRGAVAETTSASGGNMMAAGLATAGVAAAAASAVRKQRKSAVARRQQQSVISTQTQVAEKKDLGSTLPDCPSTIWKADDIDVMNLPPVEHTAPLIINAQDLGDAVKKGAEEEWFASQREKIMKQLQDHGAIWFRGFDLMKDSSGFRTFYEALQLNPCLDPIHTSGLRAYIEKKDAVYETVNKPALAQHFVGLHNESTFVKTATFGAFVCFQPATGGGGEFLVADGAKVINDMDKGVLKRLYENKVRISVSNLDLNFLGALPGTFRDQVAGFFQDLIFKVVAPKFDMDLEMVYGADKSNSFRLQAIEHAQSPINRHPVTGQPLWFCNMHNHSRYLRDRRPCTVPEVGMTDVYRGDLSTIDYEDVQHINEVCERNIVRMMMEPGDVILLDNYRVLHGRDIFKGERKHAVTWFESCGEPLKRETEREKPDDFMNTLINKTLV